MVKTSAVAGSLAGSCGLSTVHSEHTLETMVNLHVWSKRLPFETMITLWSIGWSLRSSCHVYPAWDIDS